MSLYPLSLVLFTLAYLLAAVAGAIVTRNAEFLFYIVVMLALIGAVTAVQARVRLSRAVLWGLSVWGLAHMAGGLVPAPAGWPIAGEQHVLYSLWIISGWLKYDQVVHAFGFFVTTFVCWQALRAALPRLASGSVARPSPGMIVLCVAASLGFGALNEIVEFIAVLLVPETNVGGYENTGWDLVANLTGAALAGFVLAVRR